jgi:hypothetical protein
MKTFAKKYFEIGPVEDINRSMDVVTYVLHEADDYGIATEVVTEALRIMKENPTMQISDAIVLGLETYIR